MCNLYSQTRAVDAMRQLFTPLPDAAGLGNLPPQAEIYPDQMAPILCNAPEGRQFVMGRWGMPTPPQFLIGKKTDRGVTNIRNLGSPHWRRWLGVEHRCIVPFTRFAEPSGPEGARRNVWFGLPDDRPAFFAGLWTRWTSVRKVKDGETTDDLFGFLTCPPNAVVAAHHPKAMPVILTEPEEWERWLTAPWEGARGLQRPLAEEMLAVVEAG